MFSIRKDRASNMSAVSIKGKQAPEWTPRKWHRRGHSQRSWQTESDKGALLFRVPFRCVEVEPRGSQLLGCQWEPAELRNSRSWTRKGVSSEAHWCWDLYPSGHEHLHWPWWTIIMMAVRSQLLGIGSLSPVDSGVGTQVIMTVVQAPKVFQQLHDYEEG